MNDLPKIAFLGALVFLANKLLANAGAPSAPVFNIGDITSAPQIWALMPGANAANAFTSSPGVGGSSVKGDAYAGLINAAATASRAGGTPGIGGRTPTDPP